MRAIVRYSFDSDSSNAAGNQVRSILEEAGFTKIGTASFEHRNIEAEDLAVAMAQFWWLARDPAQTAGADPGTRLDHGWIYADDPEEPIATFRLGQAQAAGEVGAVPQVSESAPP